MRGMGHGHRHDLSSMLTVEAALDRILSHFAALDPARVPLLDALGQVLAEDAVAARDIPPLDNSAMDGYAIQAGDTSGASEDSPSILKVVGYVAAGQLPRESRNSRYSRPHHDGRSGSRRRGLCGAVRGNGRDGPPRIGREHGRDRRPRTRRARRGHPPVRAGRPSRRDYPEGGNDVAPGGDWRAGVSGIRQRSSRSAAPS